MGADKNKQSLRYLQVLLFLCYMGQASDPIALEKFECKDEAASACAASFEVLQKYHH